MTDSTQSSDLLPTAEQWYTVTAVAEGITLITEPHVHPLLQANIWHLRGRDHDLVIDSSLGIVPLAPILRRLSDREPVLVLTHAHLDHLGAAHEFTQRWAHPHEPVDQPLPGSLDSAQLAGILGLGPDVLSVRLPPLLVSALPAPDFDPGAYRLLPAPATRHLRDGDTISLGSTTFTVLHLPGHTPGSIALYDSDAKALFSGDVIYELHEDEELLDEIHGADIGDYVRSMRRLARMPIDVVYPGHGPVFGGTRLRELIDGYLSRRGGEEVHGR